MGNERADQLTACTLDSIAIEKTDGQVIAVRSAPGPPFQSRKNTPWDLLRRAYFNGYALWTRLTMPFQSSCQLSLEKNSRRQLNQTLRRYW